MFRPERRLPSRAGTPRPWQAAPRPWQGAAVGRFGTPSQKHDAGVLETHMLRWGPGFVGSSLVHRALFGYGFGVSGSGLGV